MHFNFKHLRKLIYKEIKTILNVILYYWRSNWKLFLFFILILLLTSCSNWYEKINLIENKTGNITTWVLIKEEPDFYIVSNDTRVRLNMGNSPYNQLSVPEKISKSVVTLQHLHQYIYAEVP